MRTFLKVTASAFVLSIVAASAQGTMTTAGAPANPLVPGAAATAPSDVPAGVALPAIPKANHYVCYPATGQFTSRTVWLGDQFGSRNVKVIRITRVCTPATKRANNQVYPIIDPKLHYTCYAIQYEGAALPPVVTNDQFGARVLKLLPATEVCLPAGKIKYPGTN